MIHFFRRFFQSKLGIPLTLAFLALIAIAFASSDVANTGTFGGVAGGDRVAVVGDERIDSADLSRATTNALDRMRQQNPTISMRAFIEQGGLDEVLETLLDRTAIAAYARKYGFRAGENLVNSEILAIPAFRGADGNFSEDTYRQALRQAGLSEKMFRSDAANGLMARQLLFPAGFAATIPDKAIDRYAALLKERRDGAIGLLPSAAFEPKGDPSDAQLKAYYDANRSDYIRPERRVIRYGTFNADALGQRAEPTDAEIAARFERDRAQYAASESRRLTQLIVPTQEAARAIRTRVSQGGSLEAAARQAGLDTATIGPVTRAQLASQASSEVAQAVFAAARGAIAEPARSGLGWHVVRVDAVERRPARTLAQVRGEITEALRVEKRRAALSDLAAQAEDQFADGASLSDVAAELNLQLSTTRPLTADGRVYGTNEMAPEILRPALPTAFQMEEQEPQIAEVERGRVFLLFEVSDTTPSATAPLAEIRDDVVRDWRTSEGSKKARAAADRIIRRLADGDTTLAAAMRAEEARLPPAERINLTREQLVSSGAQVPPPLALLFSMAQGTAKKLEAPRNAGWYIVSLEEIEPGTIARDDPLFAQARRELGQSVSGEYADQLRLAMRKEMGVETNPTAIQAVRKQLLGER